MAHVLQYRDVLIEAQPSPPEAARCAAAHGRTRLEGALHAVTESIDRPAGSSRCLGTAERRWIVLDSLGRHVTVGRHGDPTDAELDAAAVALAGEGLGGWLAVMGGRYYGKRPLTLRRVADLMPCAVQFEAASELFSAARKAANT